MLNQEYSILDNSFIKSHYEPVSFAMVEEKEGPPPVVRLKIIQRQVRITSTMQMARQFQKLTKLSVPMGRLYINN
jgi:uncharacterized protein (DUF169 family)